MMSSPTPSKGKKLKSKKIQKKMTTKQMQEELEKNSQVTTSEVIGMGSETRGIDETLGIVLEDIKAKQGRGKVRKSAVAMNAPPVKERVSDKDEDVTRRREEGDLELNKTKAALSAITGVHIGLPVTTKVSHQSVKSGIKSLLSRQSPMTKTNKVVTKTKSGGISEKSKSLAELLAEVAKELQLGIPTKPPGTAEKKGANASRKSPGTKLGRSKVYLDAAEAKVKPGFFGQVQLPGPGSSRGGSVSGSRPGTNRDFYHTSADFSGFANDNISLDLDGRRVIIIAYRPKDKVSHARKVTEIIEIPAKVNLDNLKIARRPDGWLTIAELPPSQK